MTWRRPSFIRVSTMAIFSAAFLGLYFLVALKAHAAILGALGAIFLIAEVLLFNVYKGLEEIEGNKALTSGAFAKVSREIHQRRNILKVVFPMNFLLRLITLLSAAILALSDKVIPEIPIVIGYVALGCGTSGLVTIWMNWFDIADLKSHLVEIERQDKAVDRQRAKLKAAAKIIA
jgi:hypothetical protein